jgi:hypothetical protein
VDLDPLATVEENISSLRALLQEKFAVLQGENEIALRKDKIRILH